MATDKEKNQEKSPTAEKVEAVEPKPAEPKKLAPAKESTEKSLSAPPVPEGQHYFWGTGRRKSAVARVRMRPGSGQMTINKREMETYFPHEKLRQTIMSPLLIAKMVKSWDVWANVNGGGITGQAGAVMLGIARALAKAVPDLEGSLRDHRLLTRDARMKERKKYGQKGARKRFQFSKR